MAKFIDSEPIGSLLMVVVAESFLQMIEKNALMIANGLPDPIAPNRQIWHVDDRFQRKDARDLFLGISNDVDKWVQFTAEHENERKKLNYLEIKTINLP